MGWLPVLALESDAEKQLYAELFPLLDPGEAACLTAAIAREFVLASDDWAARQVATGRKVRLTGTIGILVRAVRDGHISLGAANGILARMIALRYRSPVETLDDLV